MELTHVSFCSFEDVCIELFSSHAIKFDTKVLLPENLDIAGFLTTCFDEDTGEEVDIPATAAANGELDTLVVALTETNLTAALEEPNGPFTLFAPNDEAFSSLPDGILDCLLKEENIPLLSKILSYHLLPGRYNSSELSAGILDTTSLSGDSHIVRISDDGVTIDSSPVIEANIQASNGIVHIVESVLLPISVDVDSFLATCTFLESEDEGPFTGFPSSAARKIFRSSFLALALFLL